MLWAGNVSNENKRWCDADGWYTVRKAADYSEGRSWSITSVQNGRHFELARNAPCGVALRSSQRPCFLRWPSAPV